MKGITFKAPALSQFCPVAAYTAWIDLAMLTRGAVSVGGPLGACGS